MNADKLINDYVRLNEDERVAFDLRFIGILRQRRAMAEAMDQICKEQIGSLKKMDAKLRKLQNRQSK